MVLTGCALGGKKTTLLLDRWVKGVKNNETVSIGDSPRNKKFAFARDLALWLSEDLLPFSLVEGGGFKRFSLRRRLVLLESEIPCRSTVSRGALEDVYKTLKAIVLDSLEKDSPYHVSTDIWTDRYRQLPYITVVVHYTDHDFRLQCVPLKTDFFLGPHTGAAILEEITGTLRDFGLREDLLFAAVSDAASNMVRGLSKFEHVRCADHRIHRGLTADFYKTTVGRRVLKLRSTLMKIYRHLIYKKSLVGDLAKEKAQEKYLDELRRAEEIAEVRRFRFHFALTDNDC